MHSTCQRVLQAPEAWCGLEGTLGSSLPRLLVGGLSSLPWGLLQKAVHSMAAGFPQNEWSRQKDFESYHDALYDLVSPLILFVRSKSPSLALTERQRISLGCEFWKLGIMRGHPGGQLPLLDSKKTMNSINSYWVPSMYETLCWVLGLQQQVSGEQGMSPALTEFTIQEGSWVLRN